MTTWIALLRGINVGGKNRLPMAELVQDLEALKLRRIQTYIQSGNVVFESTHKKAERLTDQIASKIEDSHGFRPQVLILSREELAEAIDENPFSVTEADQKTLHFFFLSSKPLEADQDAIDRAKAGSEQYCLTDKVFYLHAPDGIGRSALAAKAESFLGVPVTARNWRTVRKLDELAG